MPCALRHLTRAGYAVLSCLVMPCRLIRVSFFWFCLSSCLLTSVCTLQWYKFPCFLLVCTSHSAHDFISPINVLGYQPHLRFAIPPAVTILKIFRYLPRSRPTTVQQQTATQVLSPYLSSHAFRYCYCSSILCTILLINKGDQNKTNIRSRT